MRVYIDVLILENYIVSLFLLITTANLLKLKKNYLLIHASALALGLYTLCTVLPELKFLDTLPFKLMVPFLCVLFSFRTREILITVKATVSYIALSFLLAGFCIFIETSSAGARAQYVLSNVSYKVILIGIMIILICIDRILSSIKDRTIIRNYIFKVKVKQGGRERIFQAFLDTGNELREPATNLPVIIVEKEILKELSTSKDEKYYIPYRLVNGSKGFLIGFIPEELIIYKENAEVTVDAIICGTEEKLSKENDFHGLLSRGIL